MAKDDPTLSSAQDPILQYSLAFLESRKPEDAQQLLTALGCTVSEFKDVGSNWYVIESEGLSKRFLERRFFFLAIDVARKYEQSRTTSEVSALIQASLAS